MYFRIAFQVFLLIIVFLFKAGNVVAQKKIDQVIPDEEKRKIIHAKKLFNAYKIYEGERIVKDMVKEHPYEAYYHEALVQLQRQVLRQLPAANEELKSYQTSFSKDSIEADDNPDYAKHESMKENEAVTTTKKDTVEWDGFDSGPRKVDLKKVEKVEEGAELTEAVVTIDSALLEDKFIETGSGLKIKKPKTDKTLEKKLKAISDLVQIPYDSYKQDFIYNCRRATLQVETVDSASAYLREFLVDTLQPDIRASEAAVAAYESGMEELNANEALAASKYFQKALELNADYYAAHLALGDAYYLIGKDSSSIREYRKASLLQPLLPDPWEKISYFYYMRGEFKDAAAACINAIAIYPQQHYIELLQRIVNKTGKKYKTQWVRREVYPLSTAATYFEITALEKSPWWAYQKIESDVHGYYDSLGLVRPNDKTNERYLEVYAWKQMLKDTSVNRDSFLFARAMNEIGFLDCYVLITCFHHDLYGQFADFTKDNYEKIKEYFYMLINWDDKKYDKIRQKVSPAKKDDKKNKKATK